MARLVFAVGQDSLAPLVRSLIRRVSGNHSFRMALRGWMRVRRNAEGRRLFVAFAIQRIVDPLRAQFRLSGRLCELNDAFVRQNAACGSSGRSSARSTARTLLLGSDASPSRFSQALS